jgi:NTE family protein
LENTTAFDLHYLHILSRLFEELDTDALRKILEAGTKHEIAPGEYIFHQGDLNNTFYIVLSGRLRAVVQDKNGMHILGDIGEGEPAGEFAIFTQEPRMASVLAIRKTILLEITQNEYLNLVRQNPAFAGTLTGFLIKRLRRNVLEQNLSETPKNIALINLQADQDLRPWTDEIRKTLQESGISTQVFDQHSQPEKHYQSVFDTLEKHEGINVLVCAEANFEWSRQSLIYADLIIVATAFSADPSLHPMEKQFDLYAQSIINKKIYLVFLHEKESALPQNTSSWLANRKVNLHIHVRKHHAPDIRRFCRIISHQAVGL